MTGWAAIVVAGLSLIGVVVVAWQSTKAAKVAADTEAQAAPYDKLAARVSTLETQVDRMRRTIHHMADDLDTVVDALWEQEQWSRAGMKTPRPTIASKALHVMHRRRADRIEWREQDQGDAPPNTDPELQ